MAASWRSGWSSWSAARDAWVAAGLPRIKPIRAAPRRSARYWTRRWQRSRPRPPPVRGAAARRLGEARPGGVAGSLLKNPASAGFSAIPPLGPFTTMFDSGADPHRACTQAVRANPAPSPGPVVRPSRRVRFDLVLAIDAPRPGARYRSGVADTGAPGLDYQRGGFTIDRMERLVHQRWPAVKPMGGPRCYFQGYGRTRASDRRERAEASP